MTESNTEITTEALKSTLEPNTSGDALPSLIGTRARNNVRIPTAKQKKFAKEYAKTLNATQSALKVYDTKDKRVAEVIGSENLSKPIIRLEIEKLLKANSIEIKDILEIHKRNMLQDKNFPTSQKAVSDFYEILGMKNTEKLANEVKIAFIIEK